MRQKKLKVHSLTGRILMPVMQKAYKAVRQNRGAAGLDKVSVEMYAQNLEQNLESLMKSLKDKTYIASPLRRHYIPKGDGKFRPLGIPNVKDRVAQEVIRSIIEPIFEKMFHDNSYGFRKGRNAHQTVERIQELHAIGYKVVVDADISGFFDNIPHKLIENSIAEEIADGNVIKIIKKFLGCGVMEDGKYIHTKQGTPQGGVISPLLANIVLNKFDWALDERGFQFVRYADDFVILTRTQEEAERALAFAKEFLAKMGLKLHSGKTNITPFSKGFDFLGFNINHFGCKMKEKAIEKFKNKVKKVTVRSQNLDSEVIIRLNRIIRGTVNYFVKEFTTGYHTFRRFASWIRRRIRCMKYTRISENDNFRLRNKHIAKLGLLDIFELYLTAKG